MKVSLKTVKAVLLGLGVSMASINSAFAALPEAVTTGITTAQTDLLALLAALTAAGIAVWVGKVIYNRFRVK
jgi:hypothetical protein